MNKTIQEQLFSKYLGVMNCCTYVLKHLRLDCKYIGLH